MIRYAYKGKNQEGQKVSGHMMAEDEKDLYIRLKNRGVFLLSGKEDKSHIKKAKKLKSNQLADFSRQMASMLCAGITVIKSLYILKEQDIEKKYKLIFEDLYSTINVGRSLSEAMEEANGIFPPLMINMVKSAEFTGKLDEAMFKMADYYEKDHKLKTKIKSAMAYPAILLVVAVAVTLGIFTFVLPTLMDTFEGMDLPLSTRIIFSISEGMVANWQIILGVALAIIFILVAAVKQPQIKAVLDKIKLKIPKIGNLMSIIYTGRFARTLSTLYSSGISMVKAVEISGNVIQNIYIEKQFEEVYEKLTTGNSLSTALDGVDGLDKKLSSAIYIGEESGKLDDMLTSLADTFEYDSENATQKMLTYVEPAMIILLAVFIGIIAVSVMLPLFTIYDTVG